jgi:hypothetical protein
MRWSRLMSVLVSSLLVGAVGCGSSGSTDELVLTFVGFTGEGIDQPDSVGGAAAQVDVCQDICTSGGELSAEPYSETFVNALFVNQGGTDIRLDSYTVSVPGSGLPDKTRQGGANIPGGRCESNSEQRCALDADCGLLGSCVRQETTVELLLFDFEQKTVAVDGQCPFDVNTGEFTGGSVIPRNYPVFVTFEGHDVQTNDGVSISTGYSATFANLNNCPE